MSETEHLHPPQEPDVPSTRWVGGLGLGTIVVTVVLALIAAWVVGRYGGALGGPSYPQPIEDPFPGGDPADYELEFYLLEADGPSEGERAKQGGRERLESWGWVDREAGTVHLPIDVAMDIVASAQETP